MMKWNRNCISLVSRICFFLWYVFVRICLAKANKSEFVWRKVAFKSCMKRGNKSCCCNLLFVVTASFQLPCLLLENIIFNLKRKPLRASNSSQTSLYVCYVMAKLHWRELMFEYEKRHKIIFTSDKNKFNNIFWHECVTCAHLISSWDVCIWNCTDISQVCRCFPHLGSPPTVLEYIHWGKTWANCQVLWQTLWNVALGLSAIKI